MAYYREDYPERWTMPHIRQANAAAGRFWFSPNTIKFFHSRAGQTVYQSKDGARVAFVSSERMDDTHPRLHSARSFDPETGEVSTIGPNYRLSSAQAHKLARLYCAGQVPDRDRENGEDWRDYDARVGALVGYQEANDED